jgi:hypothetical protein
MENPKRKSAWQALAGDGAAASGFHLLQRYYSSGWAFLIPYLFLYLLYAWLKLPVNVPGGSEVEHALRWVPALSRSYQALHCLHLVLGAGLLSWWWRTGNLPDEKSPRFGRLWPLVPWLLLGLIFWIPGVYLELPADPWAHYARINEWAGLDTVQQHSSWTKSSYFLAYSFLGEIAPSARQLRWLDFYYAGCCLLLCWQFFLLARAVGLGTRAGFVFVLLLTLTFGNNIFGFFRYYGISSTLFAQLGAVGIVRIALETCRGRGPEVSGPSPGGHFGPLLSCFLLLGTVAFNHVQAVGITALGVGSILAWRAIAWRGASVLWLAGGALIASFMVVWWYPRHPALQQIYQPHGWMTPWYGFNLFSPSSPAFERTAMIVGWSGLLNILAGIFLLRQNHPVAWLTLGPLAALALPAFALPFADALARRDTPEILTFHRMLLAVPACLALVVMGVKLWDQKKSAAPRWAGPWFNSAGVFLSILAAILLIPAGWPGYNRLYHVFMRPPADLTMAHAAALVEPVEAIADGPATLAVPGLAYSRKNLRASELDRHFRLVGYANTTLLPSVDMLTFIQNRPPGMLAPQSALTLYTPSSIAGPLSGHWPAQKVAFQYMGSAELVEQLQALGYPARVIQGSTYWSFGAPPLKAP